MSKCVCKRLRESRAGNQTWVSLNICPPIYYSKLFLPNFVIMMYYLIIIYEILTSLQFPEIFHLGDRENGRALWKQQEREGERGGDRADLALAQNWAPHLR